MNLNPYQRELGIHLSSVIASNIPGAVCICIVGDKFCLYMLKKKNSLTYAISVQKLKFSCPSQPVLALWVLLKPWTMMFFVKDKLSSKQEEGVVKSEHKPYTGTAGIERFYQPFLFYYVCILQYIHLLFFLSLLSPGTRKSHITQGIFVSRLKTVVQKFFNLHYEFMN